MLNKLKKKIALLIIIITISNIFFSNILNKNVYATNQSEGANKLAGAHGNRDDGARGDAGGNDVSVVDLFDDDWQFILRYENSDKDVEQKVRNSIAQNAISACENNYIGYNQSDRYSFLDKASEVGYDPSRINQTCETDCSAFVTAIVIIVGHQLGIEKLQQTRYDGIVTSNLKGVLEAVGFKSYDYFSDQLIKGDIVLNPKEHTEIFVGDATNASWTSLEIDNTTVNLDEINFDFAGSPKNMTYLGKRRLGIWIFSKISEFIDYIVGLILNGIKYSILGYAMAFESIINNAIKAIEGT